jgi:hypothetical protein
VLSPREAVGHLPTVELNEAAGIELRHGRAVPFPPDFDEDGPVAALVGGTLAAIGYQDGDLFRPRKVFA